MLGNLLPGSATAWERAVADALDTDSSVAPAIAAIRGTKLLAPPPSFLPFLVHEYGLGELTPYVPNLYELIAEGIDWQRVRGTPAAIELALAWLGYAAAIEEEGSKRRFWNMFQLHLDRVRDADADLERIEGVARLSVPARSVFWRGFHGLDIRPLTFSQSHFGESHYGQYSGKRLRQGGPLWSFGRQYDFDVTVSDADLRTLDVFIEASDPTVDDFGFDGHWFEQPNGLLDHVVYEAADLTVDDFGFADGQADRPNVSLEEQAFTQPDDGWGWDVPAATDELAPEGLDLGWGDFSWDSTEATWTSSSVRARSEAMASGVIGRRVWFAFMNQAGEVIGYRRARALHTVVSALTGAYRVNGTGYVPKTGPDVTLYAECQTGFGEGVGEVATSVGLVFDAEPVDSSRPGLMWLEPDEITGGTDVVALSTINIAFGATIRERVKFLLRF